MMLADPVSDVKNNGAMTNVLAITSNPEPDSMTHAVAAALLQGAQSEHAQGTLLDLYDAGFNPVYGLEDREHYLGHAPIPDDLRDIQRRVAEADVLALVFPIYWYTMPAMMKGFFDRVLCRGFAYEAGSGKPMRLAGKTVRIIALTGGSQSWYESSGVDAALRNQICEQTFGKYCGVADADLLYVDNLVMGNDEPDHRHAAESQLTKITELGAAVVRRLMR